MIPDIIFFRIKDYKGTVQDFMIDFARISRDNPHLEVFLDGDAYALVGRLRE